MMDERAGDELDGPEHLLRGDALAREAWRRFVVEGESLDEVALSLGLRRRRAAQMVERLGREYDGYFAELRWAWRERQLERLEALWDDARAAWEDSRLPGRVVTTVSGRMCPGRDGEPFELPDVVTEVVVEQRGNPRLLEVAARILAEEREILGINAPKRTDVTSAGSAIKAYVGIDVDAV